MLKKTATDGLNTRRVLAASLVGTSVEFYDFYIYATAAALVFGPMFFPAKDPAVQQLSSLATLAVAFIARPLGAAVFGHFGDRVGRKSTLVASLMLMGGSTMAIAFLPGYAQVGWLAPVLLCILRFGQGFGLGGEWGGAAILAVENAPPGWRSRFGMFPQLGAPVGFVFANGLFLLLSVLLTPEQFKAWSQNLGHSGVLTTFTSYGTVPDTRQADIIRALGHGETSRDDALTQIAKLAENLLGAA